MDLSQTTAEQRQGIYADVRSLIAPGFLAHLVEVDEVRLCLRSLDSADWEVLRHRVSRLPERQWKAWMVASSIWMVDGAVVMGDEDATWRLMKMCEGLPMTVLDVLHSTLNGLTRRLTRAYQTVEGFLYEQESRRLWRTEGRAVAEHRASRQWQRFHNPLISLWVYYNEMEDARERDDQEWQIAKFLVGPHAPKSVKKLWAKDRQREGDMLKRRQRTMDRTYYEAMGVVARADEEDISASLRLRDEVRMAETPEELQEVMRRWVAGIKDDHDRVVDNVKSKIKYDVEERQRVAAQRRMALDEALAEEGFTRNQPLPLAGDAGRQFLERMRARIPGAAQVFDDHTHNRAYSKYIEKNPEVGDLHVDEDGRVVSRQPVTPEMIEMLRKPQPGERQTLQEQIERRRPRAEFVDDEDED